MWNWREFLLLGSERRNKKIKNYTSNKAGPRREGLTPRYKVLEV
jgi:hypothetical protein